MKIEIEIPKEFEEHFNQDKFKDSLKRIMADIKYSLKNGDCLCSGRYEFETIEMLEKAFGNSKPAYDIEKAVEELEELDDKAITRYKNGNFGDFDGVEYYIKKREAIEIVKQGGVSDVVCEWNQNKGGVGLKAYKIGCFGKTLEMPASTARGLKYCPYCGRKIKVVE